MVPVSKIFVKLLMSINSNIRRRYTTNISICEVTNIANVFVAPPNLRLHTYELRIKNKN